MQESYAIIATSTNIEVMQEGYAIIAASINIEVIQEDYAIVIMLEDCVKAMQCFKFQT